MDNALADIDRTLIAVSGADAVHFLQGILTQDVTHLASDKIQFAALLSAQGKILHDMCLIDSNAIAGMAPDQIIIDTPTAFHALLLKRLALYKLRAKVSIATLEGWHVFYSQDGGLNDPRHGALPHRLYTADAPQKVIAPADYHIARLALGIPDSLHDFAPDEIVAMDAGYDLLHGISFTKGCYVGQEIIARMHYKNIARRGFYVLTQEHVPQRLALLKFEEMAKSGGQYVHDGITYHAQSPEWMAPKLQQFAQAT